ncbi:metal-sensitive transcriptional regulator [Streptococcus marimammalium]|uniref:metal-sensitive transcriptional regulator n=1 Tax=Streptococcus marimammalium TaxID=269666 RepID=UPI00037D9D05|nr:metal-sensitive transcriptional regulator [Streptococcus marimammalium]
MTSKKDILNRLKRTEGQLRGIHKMVEENKECIDIVTQLSAVRSSINRIMGLAIANKVIECVEHPDSDPIKQEEKLKAAIDLVVKK